MILPLISTCTRLRRSAGIIVLAWSLLGAPVSAVDILRSSPGSGVHGSSSSAVTNPSGGVSETETAATSATSQQAQTAVMSQLAQTSLARATAMLHAQQNAQAAAQAAAASAVSSVPNGLAAGGLVPGQIGVDTPTPNMTAAVPIPVTANSNGTSSVTLPANTALTLPTTATGNSQITVSGTGVVGTITTGGTIASLTGGTSTSVAPGSTISLTGGGTITFASGSASVPASFSTYAYSSAPTPASWSGIGGITQSVYSGGASPGQTTVTLTQTSQQALLTWQSFNIGKQTLLDFDQSAGGSNVGNWVAINEIAPSIAPSQILGAIQAPGQVYVLNQNGILFGGSSQLNLHTLVASSLPINPALVSNGLLNNSADLSYLFSSLENGSGNLIFTPGATADAVANGDTNISTGGVVVEAGAQITAPTTPEHVGGRVALIGPSVDNEGTISTPDGQTILAAGLEVGLKAHDSNDPTLRGLDVYLGAVSDPTYDQNNPQLPSGVAVNGGLIESPRADVTLTGANVQQNGVIDDSTSVSLNGRIDLLADYGAISYALTSVSGGNVVTTVYVSPTQDGTVTFGSNSVTDILPELASTDTITGSQLALSSLVNVEAQTIHMAANSLLWAPSAATPADSTKPAQDDFNNQLTAGVSFDAGTWEAAGSSDIFVNNTGAIQLDAGSSIDVSGSENVSASVAENIVSAQLLGTELANSPLQQNGPLRGQTIQVDITQSGQNADGTYWVGSPIGDLSGYVGLVEHTVGELTTNGGTVSLNAGGQVTMAPTSLVNVSGGWINYAGADVTTTKVMTDGHIIDISQANPDLVYQGIYNGFTSTSQKYGISQTFSSSLLTNTQYQAGYLQGGNGGSLNITTPQLSLGTLAGYTMAGQRQVVPQAQLPTTFGSTSGLTELQSVDGIPTASSLAVTFSQQTYSSGSVGRTSVPVDVVFQPGDGTGALLANPFAGDNISTIVNLPTDLIGADGFSNFSLVDGGGNIAVPVGAPINAMPGGKISLEAANLTIDDSITSAGGQIILTADLSPLYTTTLTDVQPAGRGGFTLGSGASLDTSGFVINDISGAADQMPQMISGDSVAISGFNVDLQTGSLINVSGGVLATANGKATYGNGGSVTILAGEDGASVQSQFVGQSSLFLGATLEGYSGLTRSGNNVLGSLTIQAPLVQIGGSSLLNGDASQNSVAEANGVWGDGTTLWLNKTGTASDFFSQGGFGNITLTGMGLTNGASPAVLLAPGTSINPNVPVFQEVVNDNVLSLVSFNTPLASERAPLDLTLNAPGVVDTLQGNLLVARGNILLGSGSSITTDPLGSVTLTGQTVAVKGNITVPGGAVTITGSGNSNGVFNQGEADVRPSATVDIAGTISVAGETELTANALGYRTGTVLAGGTISVSGDIVAESSALLNVEGAADTLDVLPAVAGELPTVGAPYVPETLYSNGGSIVLKGSQELYSDASFLGAAGGPAGGTSASAGSLSLSSGFYPEFTLQTPSTQSPGDVTLVVTQSGNVIQNLGQNVIGTIVQGTQTMADRDSNPIDGFFAADKFNESGLGSLTLGGTVEFSGPVSIAANRSIAVAGGGYLYANNTVSLSAPYVAIGTAFPSPAAQQTQQVQGYVFANTGGQTGGRGYDLAPTYGAAGVLNIDAADLVDIGDLSLQGIGTFNINQGGVPAGDVRGTGTLDVAGNINIAAAQIYPTTENTFTIAAYRDSSAGSILSGNVVITPPVNAASLPSLPYSAGGTLNIYADSIVQGGVLRAPIGIINLGAPASTTDILSGSTFNQAASIQLTSGSVTSVSAVDPTTGQALVLPYGQNVNGVEWEDPAGNNITSTGNGLLGVPAKQVNLVGSSIEDDHNATIDISGGGDLYAYRFVSGTGGTQDILNTSASLPEGSYAVIPGSTLPYAPVDPDAGYVAGSNLKVGDRVYLDAGSGLPAGYYTLLPSRYALLPGAFLVTPQTGSDATNFQNTSTVQPDGSSIVAGYKFNGLTTAQPSIPASGYSAFEVAPESVVRARAEYDDSFANTALGQGGTLQNPSSPRLPQDAGQAVFNAAHSLTFDGQLLVQPGTGGQESLVDISSSNAILINGTGIAPSGFTGLVLGTDQLDLLQAGSLLIGGTRAANGVDVTVMTNDVEIANDSSTPLTGNDFLFVSNLDLTLDAGAVIQTGAANAADRAPSLVIDSGDGALLRVSSAPGAQTTRSNVNLADTAATLTVGDGVQIDAVGSTPGHPAAVGTLTFDSTGTVNLSSSTVSPPVLSANTVSFAGGLISIVFQDFTGVGNVLPTSGLILSSNEVNALQQSAQSLSLLSYSSIDLYGDGTLGVDAAQNVVAQDLAFHAAEIRAYAPQANSTNQGLLPIAPGVTLDALGAITLDNSAGAVSASNGDPAAGAGGSLTFNGAVVQLGGGTGVTANTLAIKGPSQVNLNAAQEVSLAGSASVTNPDNSVTNGQATLQLVGANLTVTTPAITGGINSSEHIEAANGSVILASTGSAFNPSLTSGLGGSLEIDASSIADSTAIVLHSGQVQLNATGATSGQDNLLLAGLVDVSGVIPDLANLRVASFTSGGQVTLGAAQGNVTVAASGEVNVSAASGMGTADSTAANAGTLSVTVPAGSFAGGGTLLGLGGTVTSGVGGAVLSQGQNGNFVLDAGSVNSTQGTSDLTTLESSLASGAFTQSQSIRIRTGSVQAVDAGHTIAARSFALSADQGDVAVAGMIDASGPTGGNIDLEASGKVTVASSALLTVEGQTFNDAGQGGSVTLAAGAYNGSTPASTSTVDLAGEVNLKVDYLPLQLAAANDSITLINPGSTIAGGGTFYLPAGTPGTDQLQISSNAGGTITTNGVTTPFAGSVLSGIPAGSIVKLNNTSATISFAGGSGGAIPIYLAADANFSDNGATNLTGGAALTAGRAGDFSGTLLVSGPVLDAQGNVIAPNGNAAPAAVAIQPITGQIDNTSHIIVEGYRVYQPAGGVIDTIESNVATQGAALVSNASTIISNLYQGNANSAALGAVTTVEPGAEVINPTGDLVLQNTWDFSSQSKAGVVGILTLRASGNVVLDALASLTDGFNTSQASTLWQAPLFTSGIGSWSYNLVAGADVGAANVLEVTNGGGSVEVGLGSPDLASVATDPSTISQVKESPNTESSLLAQFYQTIRTGTGTINIAAGSDVQLLDTLASIYTAGVQVPDSTMVLSSSYNDFALPNLKNPANKGNPEYPTAYYSLAGGNVSISALGNIGHYIQDGSTLLADSSLELPTSWLDRRGFVVNGVFASSHPNAFGQTTAGEIESTSWWVDFSNFFEGVGALGGGNVTLHAGGDISNVDAVIPTNARMPGLDSQGHAIAPNANALVELGGGDLVVQAGDNIDAGVYYVERGQGTLTAGNNIVTNSTRAVLFAGQLQSLSSAPDPSSWLPTTLFLGKGSLDVSAGNSVLLGPIANPFLLPQSFNNSYFEKTFFSTYGADNAVNVSSLTGDVVLKNATVNGDGALAGWYEDVFLYSGSTNNGTPWSYYEPWLQISENFSLGAGSDPFDTVFSLTPPTLRATAFSGSIDILGSLTLSPSPQGTIDLMAAQAINGLQPNGILNPGAAVSANNPIDWGYATINLSDANPAAIPGVTNPLSLPTPFTGTTTSAFNSFYGLGSTLIHYALPDILNSDINSFFAASGETDLPLATQQQLHASIDGGTLHANDTNPLQIYAGSGDISGITLFAGKAGDIVAGGNITDIAFYLQNNQAGDISVVAAGGDILPYDVSSPLRNELNVLQPQNGLNPLAGDIQIGGPGTLEVLAGGNLNLGVSTVPGANGIGLGITSVGSAVNPSIPFSVSGASVVAGGGLNASGGLDLSHLNFTTAGNTGFIDEFLDPDHSITENGVVQASVYLPDLGALLGLTGASDANIWTAFRQLPAAQQDTLALTIFYDVLRDAGRNHTQNGTGYTAGYDAIAALFPGNAWKGDITLTSREIKTENGGDISIFDPGGSLTVGLPVSGTQAVDQGILTVDGGNINIFTNNNVNVGTSRIFTLHGGNEIIWSSEGSIAAGASSKTVQSAPPTRVLVDIESGNIETDLAGLATGGGIGVLETVVGAPPADVDLIAPQGTVDAGDAGIRASGNLNIAAVQVLNAANITVGGKSAGVPTTSAPNIGGLAAASSAGGAASNSASEVARNSLPSSSQQVVDLPSLVSIEVLGYGGGDTE